jgi:hypothetical protein
MKTKNLFKRCARPILIIAAAVAFSSATEVKAQTIDIGPNQYAFQFTQNPNFGLFFNSTGSQYEFRNGGAVPIFSFNANNGHLTNNLQFASGSDYLVPNNSYAFRSAANPNYGLFFNGSNLRYEFRGSSGNSLFDVNASNGNLSTSGTITASGGSSTQWNQAHSWGDHAAAGYINAETDPKISETLEQLDVPRWNGSELASSAITAGSSFAQVTGTPTNFVLPGSPEGSSGNLLLLENPGAAPGTFGLTSESRLAFSKNNVVIGRISTEDNDMSFAATSNGNIIMRTAGSDRMTILSNGDVGLGVSDPSHRLEVAGTVRATTGSYAIRGTKTGSGTFPGVWGETESTSSGASGVRGYVNSTTPGTNSAGVYGHNFSTTGFGIGVRGIHDGTGWGVYGQSNGGRGVYGNSTSTSGTTAYGIYGFASGSGGQRIGVYGAAAGGTRNWAGYFAGTTYVSGDLRVGTIDGAAGYKVSVNGNMICNELRVQLTGSWPDYVFDESYERLSLDELGDFIETEKHLPNVPSAAELEEQGGVDLGEMQRLTIEKVEELTLYLLELKESNDALNAKSEALQAENEALRTRIEALEN